MFKSIKLKSKGSSYSQKIIEYKNNAKKTKQNKTWKVMKELVGKTRKSEPHSSGKLLINKFEVSDKEEIANEFNNFFTSAIPEFAKKFQMHQYHLKNILEKKTQPCEQAVLQLARSKRKFLH